MSGRLQGILRDYHVAFDLDILTPAQFARGVVAAHPYFLNPMMLGGALGAHGQRMSTDNLTDAIFLSTDILTDAI